MKQKAKKNAVQLLIVFTTIIIFFIFDFVVIWPTASILTRYELNCLFANCTLAALFSVIYIWIKRKRYGKVSYLTLLVLGVWVFIFTFSSYLVLKLTLFRI